MPIPRVTGMGFAAIARVTGERWVACSVKDDIAFGLEPGGELKLETTICHEIRESRQAVIIPDIATDAVYRTHHTPALYGFRSYISFPILLPDGRFFGTLCAIDPEPRNPATRRHSLRRQLLASGLSHPLHRERPLLLNSRQKRTVSNTASVQHSKMDMRYSQVRKFSRLRKGGRAMPVGNVTTAEVDHLAPRDGPRSSGTKRSLALASA